MKRSSIIRITGIGVFLAGILAWIYGGGQVGFYKTYYTVDKVDEITQISYAEQVEAFLPGIETLALSFVVFAILICVGAFMEQREDKAA